MVEIGTSISEEKCSEIRNPKPEIRNPKPETRNPKQGARRTSAGGARSLHAKTPSCRSLHAYTPCKTSATTYSVPLRVLGGNYGLGLSHSKLWGLTNTAETRNPKPETRNPKPEIRNKVRGEHLRVAPGVFMRLRELALRPHLHHLRYCPC